MEIAKTSDSGGASRPGTRYGMPPDLLAQYLEFWYHKSMKICDTALHDLAPAHARRLSSELQGLGLSAEAIACYTRESDGRIRLRFNDGSAVWLSGDGDYRIVDWCRAAA